MVDGVSQQVRYSYEYKRLLAREFRALYNPRVISSNPVNTPNPFIAACLTGKASTVQTSDFGGLASGKDCRHDLVDPWSEDSCIDRTSQVIGRY